MKAPAWTGVAVTLLICAAPLTAQVSYEQILNAADTPENWLTYNGGYSSQRYSSLTQVMPANVAELESKWMLQDI